MGSSESFGFSRYPERTLTVKCGSELRCITARLWRHPLTLRRTVAGLLRVSDANQAFELLVTECLAIQGFVPAMGHLVLITTPSVS